MKQSIKQIGKNIMVSLAMFGLIAAPSLTLAPAVLAAANTNEVRDGVRQVGGNEAGNSGADFTNLIQAVINILLFVIGAVAVIMIIIGGIRYTTSNGDQAQVTSAKNTILYAVVGLVVAIMAYSIVNFVLDNL